MREPKHELMDEAVDALIGDLPQPQPPANLHENFYQALEQEPGNPLFMRLAGATAVIALLLLLFVLPLLLSDLQTATDAPEPTTQSTRVAATRTPSITPTPLAVGSNAPFNQLKLKLQISSNGELPDPAEVLPIMREDFTTYIHNLPEGFDTLENGVEFFNLQNQLSPYAPYGLVLKLEDVDEDGQRELLVGILPPVLIIEPNENGEVQITELPWPEALPATTSFPSRIDTGDFDDDGRPDIRIVYSHLDYPDRENESIVVTYDGQQWVK